MTDIRKCIGTSCLLAEKCYRHTAKVNKYSQSYLLEPFDKETLACSEYWYNSDTKQLIKGK